MAPNILKNYLRFHLHLSCHHRHTYGEEGQQDLHSRTRSEILVLSRWLLQQVPVYQLFFHKQLLTVTDFL